MDQHFIKYFSEQRTSKFIVAAGNDAILLYSANLRVSQSFYPLLHILEVVLRNKIYDICADFYNDENWILHEKIHPAQKSEIDKIINFLKTKKIDPSPGKLISELNFSFWTNFFSPLIYKHFKGHPIKIFSKLPRGHGRKEVFISLNAIRKFRNRIYHNEPICFVNNNIDFSAANFLYEDILAILKLMAPELDNFVAVHDSVQSELKNAIQKF